MTRPEEPTEALPTRALPTDPGATVDLGRAGDPAHHTDATVHLGPPAPPAPPPSPDATVHFGATSPAAGWPGDDRTAHLGASEPTARFGGPTGGVPGAAEPTVHFRATPEPTARFDVPTVGAPRAAEPTEYRSAPAGPTAGAYRQATADARAVSGGTAPAPGGELRFGPGVPATPPPAPAWPAAPSARRPRPVWRRVVSVLSTLLTAALLVVVGLYLWQRLRPLEVEGVTVAVPRPPGVACDVTVDVVATVRTNGRGGVIRYQWFRSDAPPGSLLTERVGRGQRTVTLTLKWTFSGVGATNGTATVNVIEPSPVQAGTQVRYRCPGG
ncbi:hypothetical protein GCM10010169_47820 [Micromonospora fulviviridis]|uniref:hypothetical protein n=1 Tax=Micromonospora fulviviridis TaxID=47860 RepID=UPI001664B19D|nr:hypothetical protein [Micromonospora fulviviridis]GGR97702.1 hypothetical protein GCM10010169_47820 [Micromonospora fulviviridis]